MSWLDHQETHQQASAITEEKRKHLLIHMPGAREEVFVPVGFDQVKKNYEDSNGARLIIIIDEMAELVMPTGLRTEAGKEEDALKQEIQGIIQSITQLGRSAKINCILCTQRNEAKTINGTIQNNALSLDTKLLVKRLTINGWQ